MFRIFRRPTATTTSPGANTRGARVPVWVIVEVVVAFLTLRRRVKQGSRARADRSR